MTALRRSLALALALAGCAREPAPAGAPASAASPTATSTTSARTSTTVANILAYLRATSRPPPPGPAAQVRASFNDYVAALRSTTAEHAHAGRVLAAPLREDLSAADVAEQRAAVIVFRDINQRLLRMTTQQLEYFRDDLIRRGLADEDLAAAMTALSEQREEPSVRAEREREIETRQLDDQVAASALELLGLLDEQRGRWKLDPTGRPRFTDARAEARFGGLTAGIEAARARQRELRAGR